MRRKKSRRRVAVLMLALASLYVLQPIFHVNTVENDRIRLFAPPHQKGKKRWR